MARNTENRERKKKTYTVEIEIWRETLKNVKYDKYTLWDLDIDEKI